MKNGIRNTFESDIMAMLRVTNVFDTFPCETVFGPLPKNKIIPWEGVRIRFIKNLSSSTSHKKKR